MNQPSTLALFDLDHTLLAEGKICCADIGELFQSGHDQEALGLVERQAPGPRGQEALEVGRLERSVIDGLAEALLLARDGDPVPSFKEAKRAFETRYVESLLRRRREYLTATAWFQESHPGTGLTGVAYFSMEFGLSESLPIYSGGLGVLAGDYLKTAGDLGAPGPGPRSSNGTRRDQSCSSPW